MENSPNDRRKFMRALAACLALPASALLAKTPDTPTQAVLDRFMKAGSLLTGTTLDDSDLARSYFSLVRAKFGQVDIDAFLAANAGPKAGAGNRPISEIERYSMLLWLTGYTTDPTTHQPKIVSYLGAAVWLALPFTKPPGECGGAFGYWSAPPAATH